MAEKQEPGLRYPLAERPEPGEALEVALVQGNILVWRDKNHVTDTFAKQLQPTFRAMLEAALRSSGTTLSRVVR